MLGQPPSRHHRGAVAAALGAVLAACTVAPLELDGRPCGEEGCLNGFDCHPELGLCVPHVNVDCSSPTAYCPDDVKTNDPCPSVNAFIPCNNAGTECCRTCGPDLGWSMCTARACSPGAAELCDNLDNNCNDIIDEGIFACRCSSGQPTAELCNGIDDDCNDGVDDTFACELGELRDCDAGAGPTSGTQVCSPSCDWSGPCLAKDRIPPQSITEMVAVAGHQRVTLSWRHPNDPDLSLCVVQRSAAGYPNNAEQGVRAFAVRDPAGGSSGNTQDTGLENAVTYYYAAFCRDTSGNWNDVLTPGSNATTGTPTAGVPDNPTDFAAADDQDRRTTLTFTMPPAPVVSCHIRRRTGSTFPTGHDDSGAFPVATVTTPGQPVTQPDTGLVNDTTYAYAVFCYNGEFWNDAASTATGARNADTAVPRDPLPANPTDLVAEAGDASVSLSFTMPATALTQCELHRAVGAYPTNPTTTEPLETFTGTGARTYFDDTVGNGVTYFYVVFCLNGTRWNLAVVEGDNAASATPADVPLARLTPASASALNQSVLNVGSLAPGTNLLFLAAVALRQTTPVSAVSGGGLEWRLVTAQCCGGGEGRLELWWAFGSPANSFQVRIDMGGSPADLVAVVTPYAGARPAGPLGDDGRQNANGADGACTGGTNQGSWAVTVSRTAGAWTHAAVNLHEAADQSHTAGADLVEIDEQHVGSGGNRVGIAVVETASTTAPLGGTVTSAIDWAAIGVEILP